MAVNGKRVSKADVPAPDDDDSIIHVVTEVLYPLVQKTTTIDQVLEWDGRFGTLLSALQMTGLLDVLKGGKRELGCNLANERIQI